jgi:phosphoribosylaminoimidazolecarboxamide formyltransferase / IMP cyclohydrolase
MADDIKIKRVLLSVTNKHGLTELAKCLSGFKCELISTGGTGKVLADAGIPFVDISKVTGNPESFGGRMKTLSFEIESAILFDRERDKEEAAKLKIKPIDMVVCNLYDFKKYKDNNAPFEELIEHIDIGGTTLIRAAAKNFNYVTIVTDPADYPELIAELNKLNGSISLSFRKKFMAKAFNLTADYDSLIAQTIDTHRGKSSLRISLTEGKQLRYGENAHQSAKYFKFNGQQSLYNIKLLSGLELSYNNMLDLQAAVQCVTELSRQSCVIVKHNNPCGMASGDNQNKILEYAWEGDPVSAFGSVVAFNSPVTSESISFLGLTDPDKSKRKFIELIAAASFSDDALNLLKTKKNLRVIEWLPEMLSMKEEIRISNGIVLVQDKDLLLNTKMELMTNSVFDINPYIDLIGFGILASKYIKSNAIALVHKLQDGTFQLLGMGAGQPNRLESIKLAINKACANLGVETLSSYDVILVSDAFFPFEDNVDLAFQAGIKTLVQPGGSIRDEYVIARANEYKMNLIFTGSRHFKH